MANTMANADRCENCGALFSMVGRVHRCIVVTRDPETIVQPEFQRGAREFVGAAQKIVSTTYKHRDPEARRAYMRDLMRKRRAKG